MKYTQEQLQYVLRCCTGTLPTNKQQLLRAVQNQIAKENQPALLELAFNTMASLYPLSQEECNDLLEIVQQEMEALP